MNRTIVDNITLPEGFVIEKLYNPSKHDEGSWVSITKDDKGRFYTSDQFGHLYKISLNDKTNSQHKVEVEKLDLSIGLAHGLVWHQGALYALVSSSGHKICPQNGLYKVTDENKDGELDTVKLLRPLGGVGEHGPHNIILSPDKQSLYLVMGDHTHIPEDLQSTIPKVWGEDNLLPIIKDPSGHANLLKAPGGWVAKTDFEGKAWTIMTVGIRNIYDIAFNRDGELFGFDADMEYDLGMPWYRPIRLCHLTSGAEFGWRPGTGKFPEAYPDNLPAVANLGQGSPTGVMSGKGLKFPAYYQNGLYLFDWSYGTMYFASLKPQGSTYTAEVTEFLSGVPLPLTNGIVGNDGAMYFLTGGRRLESALYRLKYAGERPADILELPENTEGKDDRNLRKELETFHTSKAIDKIKFIKDHLHHNDRFIRYAARVAMENQDYDLWKNDIKKSTTTLKTINLALAIARHGDDKARIGAMRTLLDIDWSALAEPRQIDFVRAIDLLLIRLEKECPEHIKKRIKDIFLPVYLSSSETVNKELCKTLSYLQVSEIIVPTLKKMKTDTITPDQRSMYLSGDVTKRSEQYGKDVENMLRNMPNQQNISYARSLGFIKTGWTNETREEYFRWYNKALKKTGGKMYAGFIKAIQKMALANVPETERKFFETLANESIDDNNTIMLGVKQPKGPGQNWTVKSIESAYAKNQVNVNFENGNNLFKASLCASCHSINGVGGNSGPELTRIGTRFSVADLAEAIIEPSSTISDRYRYTQYHLQDGKVVTGRIIDETETELELSTNAFSPDLTVTIEKDRIVKKKASKHSPMPPALINRLNEQELSDLIAFLVSGGDRKNKIYNK